jgi:hypothetical protein
MRMQPSRGWQEGLHAMQMKLLACLLLMAGLAACAKHESRHVLSPPNGSRSIQTTKSGDGRATQIDFVVSGESNSTAALLHLDKQIKELGYHRCDKGSGTWESIRVREGASTSESVRVVRFYRQGQHANIATVFGEQYCGSQGASCDQQFSVKFSDLPDELPGRDQYLKGVCNKVE